MFVVSVALSCAVAFAQNGEWKDPPLLERGTSPKFPIPWVNEPEVVEHIMQAERDKLHPKSPLVIHKTVVVKKTNTVDDTARIMATQASGQAGHALEVAQQAKTAADAASDKADAAIKTADNVSSKAKSAGEKAGKAVRQAQTTSQRRGKMHWIVILLIVAIVVISGYVVYRLSLQRSNALAKQLAASRQQAMQTVKRLDQVEEELQRQAPKQPVVAQSTEAVSAEPEQRTPQVPILLIEPPIITYEAKVIERGKPWNSPGRSNAAPGEKLNLVVKADNNSQGKADRPTVPAPQHLIKVVLSNQYTVDGDQTIVHREDQLEDQRRNVGYAFTGEGYRFDIPSKSFVFAVIPVVVTETPLKPTGGNPDPNIVL